ncbi:hypothetical protein ASPFODRAFT_52804 [Aspergillus luchuensis CBS 106.47]|uniref:Cytochrome b5 heme-binding domain-containing protein n=1 Tax=Aspergillus luchuensis (strain CBS 106.47) TaxID=1137211 RepID=A0A1M3T1I3_ASPLC|nr:hypothetical protein ASPFODRAFT_52804 [Aspergillus luchuensis CBS 106.47]
MMGWFSRYTKLRTEASIHPDREYHKPESEHVEQVEQSLSYQLPIVNVSISDAELPFIPAFVVHQQRTTEDPKRKRCLIVVDNIVYDCTDYLSEHPGGETVIRSFNGEDCSWQFWRFHSRSTLKTWGHSLRVGRTAGVQIRYKEPPRFVGGSEDF